MLVFNFGRRKKVRLVLLNFMELRGSKKNKGQKCWLQKNYKKPTREVGPQGSNELKMAAHTSQGIPC
jgi:hypothetical protein